MKMIRAPREFSTLRFEGGFSTIKQKSYFNFLNLPLTVANFYAYRESYNQLYSSPALQPGVTFSSPEIFQSFQTSSLHFSFPNDTSQYTVSSVNFHGCRYKLNDIVRFYHTGIVFHTIKQIVVSFPIASSHCGTCEPENTFFLCERVHYHYNSKLNLFHLISLDECILEIFRASEMACFSTLPLINNSIMPPTIGRIPGLPLDGQFN